MRNQGWIWIAGLASVLVVQAHGAPKDITALSVTPAEVTFRSADEGMHVLVTGTTAEGEKIDLTASAQFAPADTVVKLGDDGLLHPVRQGDTKVTVTAGGKQAQLMVHVGDLSKAPADQLHSRRGAGTQQSRLHVRHLPRLGQGQKRIQAFAARIRSRVRLRSAAL